MQIPIPTKYALAKDVFNKTLIIVTYSLRPQIWYVNHLYQNPPGWSKCQSWANPD